MRNSSDFNKSKNLALKYLARKARSEKEIINYLIQKGFDQTSIEDTLRYLVNFDYINDKKLALSYAEYRKNFKKEGKLRIERELTLRGLSIKNTSYALATLFQEKEEQDQAQSFAEKLLNQTSIQEPEKLKRKLINKLKRKGYCDNIVLSVLKNLSNLTQYPKC